MSNETSQNLSTERSGASRRVLCSCGREEVELGCDLCRYCHAEYDERQAEREAEENPPPDEDFYIAEGAGRGY